MPPVQWGSGAGGGRGQSNQGWGGGGGGGGRGGGGGGGGGGYRGGQQQQQQNYNQYNALRGGGGNDGRKGGQQQQQQQADDPWSTVLKDFVEERPRWILSCYSHKRDNVNDLTGDVSVEEARWKHYNERTQGKPDFQLGQEFKAAWAAKEKELRTIKQVAERRQKLPSLGGAPIREPNPWADEVAGKAHGVVFGSGVGQPKPVFGGGFGAPAQQAPPPGLGAQAGAMGAPVFGQPAAFGQHAQQAPQAAGFGQQAPMGFGQQAAGFGQPAAGFGQPATGFGQPPAAAPAVGFGQPGAGGVFGQPAQAPFGTQAQPPAAPAAPVFGVQQPAAGAGGFAGFGPAGAAGPGPAGGKVIWGAAAGQAAKPGGFGQGPDPLSASNLFGQPAPAPFQHNAGLQALPAPGQGGAAGAGAALAGGLTEEELQAYQAPMFVRGKIPDAPPPPAMCT